ncbi:MAG: amidohydrolase [Ancrocorticia sp.]
MSEQLDLVEKKIRDVLLERHDDLLRLSHEIAADPELAFEEERAAARVAGTLEDAGFTVERGVYDLQTALRASYGTGDVTVAIACEYDALPGIGHACGHNLIATAAVGAALALAPVADELGIQVVLLGTPAEEAGGGKILMLQRGAWDDATFSLMIHPGPAGQLPASGLVTYALEGIRVEFTGRSAHAAAAPERGINAQDAVTLTQVGIGLLRQQLPKTVVVAYYVVEAGRAANIIPDRGVLELDIRGTDDADWRDARERVRNVARGAALATGCEVEIEQIEAPYSPLVSHRGLAEAWDTVLSGPLGYEIGELPQGFAGASTDMGNVSQYLPSIHPVLELQGFDVSPHHADFAAAAVTAAGDKLALDGALGMALTVANVVRDPELRSELLAAQAARAPFSATS